MTQLAINFPPPMDAHQLAAAERLAEMVKQHRESFEGIDFVRRRTAALKATRHQPEAG